MYFEFLMLQFLSMFRALRHCCSYIGVLVVHIVLVKLA